MQIFFIFLITRITHSITFLYYSFQMLKYLFDGFFLGGYLRDDNDNNLGEKIIIIYQLKIISVKLIVTLN